MSLDNIRVNELAKELNLTSKEVLEKFAKLSINVKAHSSTVTADQVKKIKEFISAGSKIEIKKPKAFIVKKAKIEPVEEEVLVVSEEKIEKPKIEVVKPAPSRLEIVRRAPKKIEEEALVVQSPGQRLPLKKDGAGFPQRNRPSAPRPGEQPSDGKKPEGVAEAAGGDKKPVQRHMISQDIYDNKGGIRKKVDKKKGNAFMTKEEQQERISLEKAAAQKHKKRSQRDDEAEQVTKIVVNQPLTISELSVKIQKTPAEIVKFLMMQGVMATVNQLIDIETIKKV